LTYRRDIIFCHVSILRGTRQKGKGIAQVGIIVQKQELGN
jgi:hypothetical protein